MSENGKLTAAETRALLKQLGLPGDLTRLGKVEVKLTLRKFDGEYEPGKEPIEVIERSYRR